ncbi:hypothetical protein [Tabrizicola sp.]|uniref:hypothetical protein n=1 Tax=Tabrizicola sp. TaxID=2005166 RepID=UPI002735A59A|nr:hypothetical protein [Tabrizicola sp.]MDP3197303.1 hypothetical protein [Tabrizicola sp.]
MWEKKVLVVAAVVAALTWVVVSQGRYSWHQKLTITVETPAGELSASAVSAVSWRKHWIRWDGMGWSWDLTGEAVVIEVMPGRYLFALLKGAGTTEYMGSVAAASIAGREGRVLDQALFSEVHYRSNRARGVIMVPEYQYPMLVTFDDITNPETVQEVNPEDLAAVFGEGVRLKAVTLEITEEAVTEGRVEGVLGWMCSYKSPYRRLSGKSGAIADNELSNNLGPGSFSIGECK